MRWHDRQGRPLGSLGPPGFYQGPRISHDGHRVATIQGDAPQSPVNLWVYDLESNRAVRVTQQSGLFADPAWSPGDDRIAFLCQPKGVQDICVAPAGGGGEPRLLYESSTWKATGSWMPDGKRLLFSAQDPNNDMDIMMLPADGGEPTPVLRTHFVEQSASASPDGSRMAYDSNESGRFEVYVRNLVGAAAQWQVSTDGGGQARWRADGRELFYAAADGGVMAVPLPPGAGSRPGTPVRLFLMPERPDAQAEIFEDVTPDGQRILLNVPTTARTSIGFHAIVNWPALLGSQEK
jgi:Tol biopolymer transport system component